MVNVTGETDDADDCKDDVLDLFTVYTAQGIKDGIFVKVELAGKPVNMQVDTGASVSLIPESLYHEHLKNCSLQPHTKASSDSIALPMEFPQLQQCFNTQWIKYCTEWRRLCLYG